MLNLSAGYFLAVTLGHVSRNSQTTCEKQVKVPPVYSPSPKTANTEVVQASRPSSAAKEATVVTQPIEDKPRSKRSAAEEAAITRGKLKDVQSKLLTLRGFGDKTIARSLSGEIRGHVQSQFSFWEKVLDEAASESETELIMQNLAHAEATLNNIDHLDWTGSLDEIIDLLEKQISVFVQYLAE